MTEAELRDKALLYWRAHRRLFEARVGRAKRAIIEALEKCPPHRAYVAWSGGKDSTALAHLVHSIAPEVEMVSQVDDLDFPDKLPYMERVAKQFSFKWRVLRPEFSVLEYMRKHGIGIERICAQTHQLTKDAFLKLFERYRAENGKDMVFLGLRAEESPHRRRNRACRGLLYQHKDGLWVATPIADWRVWDVFAYHVINDIPIRPLYLKGDPEKVRSGWVVPPEGAAAHGGVQWLRQHYPEVYAKLAREFPELRRF